MSEADLEKKVSEYAQLAKEDKNIDVAALMLDALQNQKQNMVSTSAKRWGYLISLGVPPLGLLFAIWFYFSDKEDGRRTAWVCIALTVMSLVIFWASLRLFISTSGVSVEQIETIKPADIQQLTE